MNASSSEARGSAGGARRIRAAAGQPQANVPSVSTTPHADPIVDARFTAVCATVLVSLFIMAAILAMGSARPVPVYGIVGSALFGVVFGAFLMGAVYLAVTDSRRSKDHDH